MISIQQLQWVNSKAQNPSQKLFVERWLALFNRYTIDIYRVRFHNTHTILLELLQLIDAVNEFSLPLRHLKWVAEEATSLLGSDPVIRDVVSAWPVLMAELNNNSYWNGKEPLSKVKTLLKTFIQSFDQKYLTTLIDSLKEKINKNEDELILKITKLIGSECIFLEFSTQYLNKAEEIFFAQSGISFEERLDNFIGSILTASKKFTVIIRFDVYFQENFPPRISDVDISRSFKPRTASPIEASYLSGGDYTWFAQILVEAKDPFMAGTKASQTLAAAIDIYACGFPLDKVDVSTEAIVYQDGVRPFEKVKTRPLIPGFVRSDIYWFNIINENLAKIYEAKRISPTTKDKIRSSLRYMRQGREAINLEEKFMNFWIGLEFLLRGEGYRYRYIIEPIMEFAPRILSLYHPKRLLRDLIENIKRLRIKYSENIREKLAKQKKLSSQEACMLSILRSFEDTKDLLDSCGSSPLLQCRIQQLAERFSSSGEILNLVRLNTQNIEWHLARIYRHRNRILHGAEYNLALDHLSSNVTAYVTEILNTIVYQLSRRQEWNSIDDVVLACAQTYNIWTVKLQKDKNNDIPLDEIVDPIVTMLPSTS